MRLLGLALSIFIPVTATASNLEVACWWEPYRATDSADDTGQFYDNSSYSLKFDVDLHSSLVRFPGDETMFGSASVVVLEDSLRVFAVQPNMKFLKGKRSVIEIHIDRYTLKSIMTLRWSERAQGELERGWTRFGECVKRQA